MCGIYFPSQGDQPRSPGVSALHKVELLSAEVDALRQQLATVSTASRE
jgi:hypothetical protein